MKSRFFTYQRLWDEIVAELGDDRQLFDPNMLSVRARDVDFVASSGAIVTRSDPRLWTVGWFLTNRFIVERTSFCGALSSYLCQNAHSAVDEPGCFDMTKMQASVDAIQ